MVTMIPRNLKRLKKEDLIMSVFLTNDGVSIHYEVNGSGRPLVMLHGWDQSARAFCRNVPALSEKYQVVTVDFRGHGESEKPSHGYRISRLAMDVHQLLEHLDLKDVVLLGWDDEVCLLYVVTKPKQEDWSNNNYLRRHVVHAFAFGDSAVGKVG